MVPTKAVFPEGHVHWFYRCFKWWSKDVVLESVQEKEYTVVCKRAVYTTDGRFFYGWYTPGAYEDLDEFSMMPPDFLFCCQCCCYGCCKCYRKRYNAEYKRESDLFFGRAKREDDSSDSDEEGFC